MPIGACGLFVGALPRRKKNRLIIIGRLTRVLSNTVKLKVTHTQAEDAREVTHVILMFTREQE